jgi:hypothetical protein
MSDHNPHPSEPPEIAEDQALVQFLRQHRPSVPAAASNLEERLMQGLPQRSRRPRAAAWASVPVLAASALFLLQSRPIVYDRPEAIVNPLPTANPVTSPTAETQLSEAELASLGSFLDPPSDSPSSGQELIPLVIDPAAPPHPQS